MGSWCVRSAEADDFEGLGGAFLAVGPAGVKEGEFDVFQGVHAWQEVEGLEDEADASVADVGEGVVGDAADVFAGEDIGAGGGAVEAAEDIHEGGFAGAGGSADGDHFAGGDLQADTVEGVDDVVAHDVSFPQVGPIKSCIHGHFIVSF